MVDKQRAFETAKQLVMALDEDAILEALMQAHQCNQRRDLPGLRYWRQVRSAVEEIQGQGVAVSICCTN